MNRTAVGVDIAKNVFQLHYIDPATGEIVNKPIKRAKFLEFFANREPCRMTRECHVRFCERLRAQFPRPTHPYIRVKGEWRYLYRAVDKDGNTIDFLLRAHRDKTAARRYFEKSMAQNGVPETVTIDKSGANLAALEAINVDRDAPIRIRQCKYLNNVVEQDHRAIKRRTQPMLGFKSFRCARILLAGIEVMHMIAKGQMKCAFGTHPSAADQFYGLAT